MDVEQVGHFRYNFLWVIVIKLGPEIDLVYKLGHWVTGSTSGSMVESHGQIKRF